MDDYQQFLESRIIEIQTEIDELPEGATSERNADSLGIDKEYYKAGFEIFEAYKYQKSWEKLQLSRAFNARFAREGMGVAHVSEARRA